MTFACACLLLACGQGEGATDASASRAGDDTVTASRETAPQETAPQETARALAAPGTSGEAATSDSSGQAAPVATGAADDDDNAAAIQSDGDPASDKTLTAIAAPATTPLGSFELTYYWMANQSQVKSQSKKVQLYSKDCSKLTKVSKSFAKQLDREGTGQLSDGRTINVSGDCKCQRSPCYFVLDRDQRWGVGVGHRPLSPFRSVAVDPAAVPIGTLLYLPELDGLTMPGKAPYGGFVHDGCVVADDRGGAVDGHHIDLFMAKKSHYQAFDRRHRLRHVTVFDGRGRCSRDGDRLVPTNRNSI